MQCCELQSLKMKKPQINEAFPLADRRDLQYVGKCSHVCQYYPFLIPPSQVSRNTLSVAEVLHESSARNNVLVPGHSQQPPGRMNYGEAAIASAMLPTN